MKLTFWMEAAVVPNPQSSNLGAQASRARPQLDVVPNLLAAIVSWIAAALTRFWLSTHPAQIIQSLSNPALSLPSTAAAIAALQTILRFQALATRCVVNYGRRGIRPIALVLLPPVLYLASEGSGEGWIGSGLKTAACIIWVWAFIELEFMGA